MYITKGKKEKGRRQIKKKINTKANSIILLASLFCFNFILERQIINVETILHLKLIEQIIK